ncbi:MAG: hypothetical protein K2W95_25425 [Candidatus Obscuribacterales bacterium]|nr:hypothetical protein [Candidatus Obscuribacterales bacterium]
MSKILLFAILVCGLAFAAHIAVDESGDTRTRLIYAACAFGMTALSGLALRYIGRQPVYEAVDKLQAQIDEMQSEPPPAEDSLQLCYTSMLESARQNYDAALAKVKQRRWGYAYHCAKLGLQNIKNYRDAAMKAKSHTQ